MATKFTTLSSETKKLVETVFTSFISSDLKISVTNDKQQPYNYDNVLYLGHDNCYGDVFKVWNNEDNGDFTIVFGVKGDEFK